MKKAIGMLMVLILCFGVLGCGGEESSTQTETDKANTTTAAAKETRKEYYFKNNVAVLEDVKFEITDYKVIKPGQAGNEYGDKPVIAFWYKVTNTGGGSIDPTTSWMTAFTAIQDNNPNAVNKLEVGMLPDDQYMNSQLEEIKPGGTVENAVSYELDDTTTPVILKATNGIIGEEIGEQTYKLKK